MVMFRHLIAENPSLKGHLEEKGIREEQLDFIESLIDPESPSAHRKNVIIVNFLYETCFI